MMQTEPATPDIAPRHGVPRLTRARIDHLWQALALGWADFSRAPVYGISIGAVCALAGWALVWITQITGQTYWLVLGSFGFPLVGPFTAVGLYEVSRRREAGVPITPSDVFGVIWQQRLRQLPSLCAVMVVVLLFWFFLGHMIFALFLVLSAMTNISTSYEVLLTPNGLMMLAVGTAVGAGFATLLFSVTVVGLPLLLHREDSFFQVLEGEEDVVRQVFDKIQRDPRHERIKVLFEGPIEAREFADWRMGFVDLNGVDVKNLPGFSDFLSDDVEPRRLLEELTQVKRLLLLFRAME